MRSSMSSTPSLTTPTGGRRPVSSCPMSGVVSQGRLTSRRILHLLSEGARLPWRDRMSLKHPTERGDVGRRGLFDRLAQRASYFSSSPLFFVLCVALVLAWLAGHVFDAGRP